MTRRIALVAALLVGVFAANMAAAQSFPPHRFFGSLTINGQPAATGTVLRAFIGETECATSTVSTAGSYVIDVPGVTINPNCGRSGQSTVTFRVDGQAASQTPGYRDGGFQQLDLTIGGGGANPGPTPTSSVQARPATRGSLGATATPPRTRRHHVERSKPPAPAASSRT